ncbi:MAG: helix-turn-helix domain-containing protein [Treponema sp.]|nr:helix-turn-helix domain-containing protein [Treponema sp.]
MNNLTAQKFWTENIPCHFEFRNPQPPFPVHSHNFYEIAIVYKGKGTHITPDGDIPFKTGEIIVVKPGQIHGYKDCDGVVLMNIMIRSNFIEEDAMELSNLPKYNDFFVLSRKDAPEKTAITQFNIKTMHLFELRAMIDSIQEEISRQPIGWTINTTTYLIQLILYLLRVYNSPSYPETESVNHADMLIKYMEKNFRNDISMQDLMEYSNMSESSVLRTFKRITGYPPFEYQMRQRMFAASRELSDTKLDITQIAYDVGYNDSNYFSRCFKKFMNMTPRDYRSQFGKKDIQD